MLAISKPPFHHGGLENEVPFAVTIFPDASDKTTIDPCAITSGLILLSKMGQWN
jgi:hypothetical protein